MMRKRMARAEATRRVLGVAPRNQVPRLDRPTPSAVRAAHGPHPLRRVDLLTPWEHGDVAAHAAHRDRQQRRLG